MIPTSGSDEQRLDALFRAYAALPTPEPSVNFMPGLWKKIEARQSFTWSLRRMANAFVAAAVAMSVALGIYMAVPRTSPLSPQSYLEALADAHPLETPDLVSPVRLDLSDPGR